ncbi:hypothetical protein KP79_PYT21545 [Mizuhopecten yessoensis]|uniref:Uncharacterized protein n=1 Tax=Mizuhopecten yessoensis TaxID=6573 RepID=A0A210R549_MIZYE|nr:hypothetical protein KP79_PYT21545 [Mizuhopecten yessoensis]
MNYLEIGLPHINLAPRLTVSPRPLLPVSGLSRKYLGIEGVSKKEIDTLVNRLSKPKSPRPDELKHVNPEDKTHAPKCQQQENIQPDENIVQRPKRSRFIGSKKMSVRDIGNMVDRLSKTKPSTEKTQTQAKRACHSNVRQKRGLMGSYAWQGLDHHLHKPVRTSPSFNIVMVK